MGLFDRFKKKKQIPIDQNPVQISDGGSFLVRTGQGKSVLVLLPVWNPEVKQEAIDLFLTTGGEIEGMIVVNQEETGYLFSGNYISALSEKARGKIFVTQPARPWYRYQDLGDIPNPENMPQAVGLPPTLPWGKATFTSGNSGAWIMAAYHNPRRGGTDVTCFGTGIEPDTDALAPFLKPGINLNIFGSLGPEGLPALHNLQEKIFEELNGRITCVLPNAVKGIDGEKLAGQYKNAGFPAVAVGTAES